MDLINQLDLLVLGEVSTILFFAAHQQDFVVSKLALALS